MLLSIKLKPLYYNIPIEIINKSSGSQLVNQSYLEVLFKGEYVFDCDGKPTAKLDFPLVPLLYD